VGVLRVRRLVVTTALTMLAASCASNAGPTPSYHGYMTHCGVAQTEIGGVTYYPTEIHVDGALVGVGSDPGNPDSRWVSPEGDDEALSDAIGQFDFFLSGGQVRVFEDGTARFSLGKTDVEVALSPDPARAAHVFAGCY
jgi:hypothetical protein